MLFSAKALATTFFAAAATTTTFACELSPASQVVSFPEGAQDLQEFYISYQGCGWAQYGQSLECYMLPDELGRLGGAFVEAAPQTGFAGGWEVTTGRTLTFHGFTGAQAQGDLNIVVFMGLAPSLIKCEFAGTVVDVNFVYRDSPTAAPVELPETKVPTASPRPTSQPTFAPTLSPTTSAPTPQPTFAPTPSPTTATPTSVPTLSCPCYTATVDESGYAWPEFLAGVQVWQDFIDGVMPASNIKSCKWDLSPGNYMITLGLHDPPNSWMGANNNFDTGGSGDCYASWEAPVEVLSINTGGPLAKHCRNMLNVSIVENYGMEFVTPGASNWAGNCQYQHFR